MKLPTIIYPIVLGLAASVQAKDKATDPNEPTKLITPPGMIRNVPDPAVNIGTDANGSINIELNGGRLVDAIAEIASHVSRGGAGAQSVPNLIYGGVDVPDLVMSGKSRMAGVTPVQAVALVCAAAGCTLEPIYAPAEEAVLPGASGPVNPGKVIGYRIDRASTPGGDTMAGGYPTETVTQPGGGGVSKGMYGDAMVSRGGEVTQLAGGGALKGGGGGNMAPVAPSSRRNSLMSSPQSAPSADTTERVVRVYALGSLLARTGENGSVETPETQKRRDQLIRATEELISQTLAQAELKAAKSPDLSFNEGLRVLIGKATAAQHEIILQIIQALKENETVPAQANNFMPTETILPTPAPSAEKSKSNP